MPIERYMEGMETAPPAAVEAEEAVMLPKSILAGKSVAVGDVVRLTVTSVDGENIGVEYAEEAPAAVEPEKEGIAGMAAAFD